MRDGFVQIFGYMIVQMINSTWDCAPQLLAHGLPFQTFHIEVIRLSWHNEENHHGHVTLMDLTDTQWTFIRNYKSEIK